jgi:hypothetical protein
MSFVAVYGDESKTEAKIGDMVMMPGSVRGIVSAIEGTFVTVIGIGTDLQTGATFVLPGPAAGRDARFIKSVPASDCVLLEKQLFNLG